MGQENAGSGLRAIQWLPLASANRAEHLIDMLLQHPKMGRPRRKKDTRELAIKEAGVPDMLGTYSPRH